MVYVLLWLRQPTHNRENANSRRWLVMSSGIVAFGTRSDPYYASIHRGPCLFAVRLFNALSGQQEVYWS